jgi:ssDNA-specific exonuclease RecJ
MPINDKKITDWEKRIHPLLFPKTLNPKTEYLSTNGAHKNFKEYVRTSHAKKPISVKEIPTSLSQAVSVEKTSI